MKKSQLFKLFIIGLILSITSCSSSDKYTVVEFPAAKLLIDLPDNYQLVEIDNLDELISKTDSEGLIAALQTLKKNISFEHGLKLVIDTTNPTNYINIKAGQKIGFNADNAEKLSKMTKENLQAQVDLLGGKVYSKEIALRNGENHPYMKLKFKTALLERSFFQTSYLIKGALETYGISVVSEQDNDLEEYIKTVKIK